MIAAVFALVLSASLGRAAPAAPTGADAKPVDLSSLSAQSNRVVVGKVLSTRVDRRDDGLYTVATVQVEDTWRGKADPVIEVATPGGRKGDEATVVPGTPKLVEGYKVVLFLDGDNVAGWGRGVFLVEGGFAWQPLHNSVFTSPRADRDWVKTVDPSSDYAVYSLDELRKVAEGQPATDP